MVAPESFFRAGSRLAGTLPRGRMEVLLLIHFGTRRLKLEFILDGIVTNNSCQLLLDYPQPCPPRVRPMTTANASFPQTFRNPVLNPP